MALAAKIYVFHKDDKDENPTLGTVVSENILPLVSVNPETGAQEIKNQPLLGVCWDREGQCPAIDYVSPFDVVLFGVEGDEEFEDDEEEFEDEGEEIEGSEHHPSN